MVDALHHEIASRKNYLDGKPVSTIYFGGGTPSLLSGKEIYELIEKVRLTFDVMPLSEITLEANPDDLTFAKLQELRDAGINRLSIGMQSFHEEDLVFMNRSHTVDQSMRCINDARKAGFNNISVDLIFALPGRDLEWMRRNIDEVIGLDVEHISCYGLTVEPRTVLDHQVRKGVVKPASDKDFTAQYEMLNSRLKSAGYEQYEISNFAKPGFYSRHNSSYWSGESYIGIGPGAHSFNGITRRWNIRNNPQYIKLMNQGAHYFEDEELTSNDRINEYILTSLRTSKGTDLVKLKSLAGPLFHGILKDLEPYLDDGSAIISENSLLLTEKGKFICDRITSDLFVTNAGPDNS